MEETKSQQASSSSLPILPGLSGSRQSPQFSPPRAHALCQLSMEKLFNSGMPTHLTWSPPLPTHSPSSCTSWLGLQTGMDTQGSGCLPHQGAPPCGSPFPVTRGRPYVMRAPGRVLNARRQAGIRTTVHSSDPAGTGPTAQAQWLTSVPFAVQPSSPRWGKKHTKISRMPRQIFSHVDIFLR